MARLNIDDEWFITDPRRPKLIALLGCQFKADGMALAAWRLAQRYWKQDESPIPDDKWAIASLDPLIVVGLARRVDGGVYVCGVKEFADWLTERAESGSKGGKASAEVRKQKYGSAQPKPRSNYEAQLRSTEASFEANPEAPKPPTPTPTPNLKHNYVSEPAGSRPPTPLDLAALWNDKRAPSQPEVRLSTFKPGAKRWTWALKRLAENPDLAYWSTVIARIAASHWCNGGNDSGWRADFEFLIRQETHLKAAEGKYDNRKPAAPKAAPIPLASEVTRDFLIGD